MSYHEWACGALTGNDCNCGAEPWEKTTEEPKQSEISSKKVELAATEKPVDQEWFPECHP